MSNSELYGIIGSGEANAKIIVDGLSDVNSEDTMFLIHARRKPQGSVETVYDFLADNEAKFVAYHRVDDNAPKALLEMAQSVQTTDDPAKSIITSLKRGGGTLLLLWDEENPSASEAFAIMASDAGVPIKDLTNGLSPIVVESDENESPKEETVAPKNSDDAPEPFTREELMSMTVAVLRRQAKALGLDMGNATKEDLVETILGINNGPEVASDVHVSAIPHTPPVDYAVIVWHENGMMQVAQVPVAQAKTLLG